MTTIEEALTKTLKHGTTSVTSPEEEAVRKVMNKYGAMVAQSLRMAQIGYPEAVTRGIIIGLEIAKISTAIDDFHVETKNKLMAIPDPFGVDIGGEDDSIGVVDIP